MYDRILVPTDGSQHAQRAAEHARSFATRFGAGVDVLTVVDVDAAAGPFSAGGVSEDYAQRLEAAAADTLEDVETLLGDEVTIRSSTVRGRPRDAIPQYVTDNGIDAITMGTHGRTGVHRFVAGSVTESVLREAAVPVLTVRAVERSVADGYDSVVIPTDGSEPASLAVDHGIEVARAFDARVHALNIVDMNTVNSTHDYPFPEDLLEALREAGETATDAIVERARAAGLDATGDVRRGFPASGILEYAEAADADLIVMGTTGQTGLSRFLLGSTTERVVRHAEIPVFAVNARTDG